MKLEKTTTSLCILKYELSDHSTDRKMIQSIRKFMIKPTKTFQRNEPMYFWNHIRPQSALNKSSEDPEVLRVLTYESLTNVPSLTGTASSDSVTSGVASMKLQGQAESMKCVKIVDEKFHWSDTALEVQLDQLWTTLIPFYFFILLSICLVYSNSSFKRWIKSSTKKQQQKFLPNLCFMHRLGMFGAGPMQEENLGYLI